MNFKSLYNRIFNINAASIMGSFSKAVRNLETLQTVLEEEVEEKVMKAIKVETKVSEKVIRLQAKAATKVTILQEAKTDAEVEYKKTAKYLKNLKALLED